MDSDQDSAQQLITTVYVSTYVEARKHLRAARDLGFGIEIKNTWAPVFGCPGEKQMNWTIKLWADAPDEEEEEEEDSD
jgi:hypothetical protein